MIFEYLILIVVTLFPYNMAGQDAGAAVLCLLGAVYLLYRGKNIVLIDKKLIITFLVLHSLFDFDFSFATILILLIMHSSAGLNESGVIWVKTPNMVQKVLVTAAAVIGFYSVLSIASMNAGDYYASKGDFNKAREVYSFNRGITIRNPDVYYAIAQSYYKEAASSEGADTDTLMKYCRDNLKKAEARNGDDPRISGNLAFVSGALGDTEGAVRYFKKSINTQKYGMQLYYAYYNYLMELFKNTQDEKYLKEVGNLKRVFKNNYKSLNPKAKYLKGQLTVKEWTE